MPSGRGGQIEAEAGVEGLGGQGDLVGGIDAEALERAVRYGESTVRSSGVIVQALLHWRPRAPSLCSKAERQSPRGASKTVTNRASEDLT